MATLNLTFSATSELRRWLKNKNNEAGNPETYHEWLYGFFDGGNTITVHGEEWDYWSCWELL